MADIPRALLALRPGARWSFDSSRPGLEGLTWLDEVQTPPTLEEVTAEIARLEGPPGKEQRIAYTLATLGKGKDRTVIQLVIHVAETFTIPALATQYGVSFEVAKAQTYARNKTYRESKDCEAVCLAIEAEP